MKIKKAPIFFIMSLSLLSLIPSLVPHETKCVSASDEEVESLTEESCSVMYVGKNVSENGLPIICRTGDGANSLIYHSVRRYNKDEFANKAYKGKNGFSWQMPEHTYAFTGFPRSSSVGTTLHWDVSTMNEAGVATSATLSCKSNEDTTLEYDPFVETGISEDNIAGIIAATSSTARGGIEYLANVIDKNGSAEANIIMTLDQSEAWLMEIYSGHQYCAVKLPDDKVCTIGNEFFLNTLADFPSENVITSPNLFSLPKEKGFAKFEGGSEDKNMHLFYTYAVPLTYDSEYEAILADASHMRTWIGRNLFAKEEEKVDYQTSVKFEPFFTPARKLSINDCFVYFRDRYQSVLNNPDPKYDLFRLRKEQGMLRNVGVETSYQVHVMMVHNDLPKEMAIEAWISMGNAVGAPFVPFNNLMTSFPEEYSHEVTNYGPDQKSIGYINRRISSIANLHLEEYAYPIQAFWNVFEDIWKTQYNSCLAKAKELINSNKKDDAGNLLNNYLYDVQSKAISEAKLLCEDLTAHFMQEQTSFKQSITDFVPKTNILSFADLYGYKHEIKDNKITLTLNDKVVTIDFTDLTMKNDGVISCGEDEDDFEMNVINNNYYGDMSLLKEYVAKNSSLKEVNFDQYINVPTSDINPAYILIPIAIVVVISLVAGLIIFRTRKNKQVNKD